MIDTMGMNRISGKLLKTRGSDTLVVAGIPCLILGLCQGSMGAAVTDGAVVPVQKFRDVYIKKAK